MIPVRGCDPERNIVSIGGIILRELFISARSTDYILIDLAHELNISMDHMIIALDWLFTIKAVDSQNNMVVIHASA